jgi:hypothetical protein
LSAGKQPPETCRDEHRVKQQWRFQHTTTSRNFSWLVCKKRNALAKATELIELS